VTLASRLCRPGVSAFDGRGGLIRGGRWHEQGHLVVYAAASEALAVLEVLVHLSSVADIPVYKCVKASIPDDLIMGVREAGGLPEDWNTAGSGGAKRLGTRWLTDRRSAVLSVPSVVVPREFNYVINPAHPEFGRIHVGEPMDFVFDVRLGNS